MARPRSFDETAVLERARDLFWERGYSATSIGDLERALGISRSSLYATFGDKRALYDRTLAAYQRDNLARLRALLAETPDLRATLTELFVDAALASADCPAGARGCYIVNATTEMANACPRALHFVSDNRERFVAILAEGLAAARARGQLAPPTEHEAGARPADDRDVDLANYLFVCYNGLQVALQTGIAREDLVAAVRRGVDALPWRR